MKHEHGQSGEVSQKMRFRSNIQRSGLVWRKQESDWVKESG